MTPQIAQACRLHERAVQARARGNFDQALSLGQRALPLLEHAAGAGHPDVANVLLHLAGTAEDQADVAAAEPRYRRAVEIMEQCVPAARQRLGVRQSSGAFSRASPSAKSRAKSKATEDSRLSAVSAQAGTPKLSGDPDLDRLLVQSLSGLGNLLRTQGRYAEAAPLLRRALKSAEAAFGPEDLEVATALNNLGILYKFNGQYAKAPPLYRRALRIVEKAGGATALSLAPSEGAEGERAGVRGQPTDDAARQSFLATLYHNLGGLEHARGRCARGEPFARHSVELREAAFGPDHPAVAEDVAALAALLDGQGKFDEAEPLYHRALAIFERVHGPDCYDVAVNLNNLAAIQQARGNFPEAERLYRRALALKEKLLGPGHPDTGMTLHNLAVLYRDRARPADARPLARRALAIFERALGRAHPHTVAARENCAALRRESRHR